MGWSNWKISLRYLSWWILYKQITTNQLNSTPRGWMYQEVNASCRNPVFLSLLPTSHQNPSYLDSIAPLKALPSRSPAGCFQVKQRFASPAFWRRTCQISHTESKWKLRWHYTEFALWFPQNSYCWLVSCELNLSIARLVADRRKQ